MEPQQPTLSSGPRLGVDLGGSKIEAIVLSDDGSVTHRKRISTPKDDYSKTLHAIADLIDDICEQAGLPANLPIGIGTPGAISLKTGALMNCNSTCLNGHALQEDLAALIQRPVRIANDADCFALSEANDGAASGQDIVFGVILGTGVGGGIVFKQQLAQGINAISGEWGHNSLPLDNIQPEVYRPGNSRDCFCGRRNCVETWLAGPSFERSYLERSGVKMSAIEIVNEADHGNKDAIVCLDQYCNLLALALSNVINILDPQTIVLGGGMSNINNIYEALPRYLPRYVFSDQLNTRIVKARYGDSSGARGAARLWPGP